MPVNLHLRGHCLDNDLVALMSSLLDKAGVPNLLWGNYLLSVYGVPTIVDGVAFVVPDVLVNIFFSTLSEAGLYSCTESAEFIQLPPAMLGRGSGRFASEHSFVQIPSASRYCEYLVLLLCCDNGTDCASYWMAMLTYTVEFVDEVGLFNEDSLEEVYRPFYVAVNYGGSDIFRGDRCSYIMIDYE
ncbi:hypothetical protein BDV32DRAFT_134184 [Aspergillus pseudonomiae]|uniref:Uncharacterized protein n=1 Tax=Aspergillus pseudonomiae TaxID=1506151 RepID=A0A5N6IIF6_9EURO|nr:uncharacterized protein BDV37DRAFT_294555 [Aspergillus pseudonomiae]KAB8266146.1 hypothetical protein BDV32DRAFT_134184 [Aspergillus pseudonomiae]KAE8409013.1 hypothetical protein BDV37DRAFT_294555 [Aspergillus pseudonomiae]